MRTSQLEPKPSTMSRLRKWLNSPWVGGALIIAMIAALRLIAPWSEWLDNLRSANPTYLAIAGAFVLPYILFRLWRMETMIPELSEFRGPHGRVTFASMAIGQLPTGSIGGDAYRVVKFTCLDICEKRSTAATVILRLVGFAVTILIGGALAAWYLDAVPFLLASAIGLGILVLIATSQNPPSFVEKLRADPEDSDEEDRGFFAQTFLTLRHMLWRTIEQATSLSRKRLFAVIALTFGMTAARASIVWFCLLCVGLDAGWLGALFALSAGNLMSTIPSPAGSVGLREGGMVGALIAVGMAAAPAAIAAVLYRFLLIAVALVGWLVCVALFKSPDKAGSAEPTSG